MVRFNYNIDLHYLLHAREIAMTHAHGIDVQQPHYTYRLTAVESGLTALSNYS